MKNLGDMARRLLHGDGEQQQNPQWQQQNPQWQQQGQQGQNLQPHQQGFQQAQGGAVPPNPYYAQQ